MTLHEELAQLYFDILSKDIYQPLIQHIAHDQKSTKKSAGLTNLFLGFVPDYYATAGHQILVVGRDVQGWRNREYIEQYDQNAIELSMNYSKEWLKKHLNHESQQQQEESSFFNFIKKIAEKSGDEGISWANLFAVDIQKLHPRQQTEFNLIKQLSKELLQAQITVLQPDIVLFFSGLDTQASQARREYFPRLIGSGQPEVEHLPKQYLERFYFNQQSFPICYRTCHPCNKSKYGRQGLRELLKLLPEKS